MKAVVHAAFGPPWRNEYAREIQEMRERLEASRSERDLKRGFGGIVDVEFLVQLLQLKYGRDCPGIQTPNTRAALQAARDAGLLSASEYATVRGSYDFLRTVQGRLRIVHNRSLDELPETPEELEKFARRLGWEAGQDSRAADLFLHELERHTSQTRALFLFLLAREQSLPSAPDSATMPCQS